MWIAHGALASREKLKICLVYKDGDELLFSFKVIESNSCLNFHLKLNLSRESYSMNSLLLHENIIHTRILIFEFRLLPWCARASLVSCLLPSQSRGSLLNRIRDVIGAVTDCVDKRPCQASRTSNNSLIFVLQARHESVHVFLFRLVAL